MPLFLRFLACLAALGVLAACPAPPRPGPDGGEDLTDAGGAADGGDVDSGTPAIKPSGMLVERDGNHLRLTTVTAGTGSAPRALTSGAMVERAPSFSLDGTSVLFVREDPAGPFAASIQVLDLGTGVERELASYVANRSGGVAVTCQSPVHGSDGNVYYGVRTADSNTRVVTLTLMRVPFLGGLNEAVAELDGYCTFEAAVSADHRRVIVNTAGVACADATWSLSLPQAAPPVRVPMSPPEGVQFSSVRRVTDEGRLLIFAADSAGALRLFQSDPLEPIVTLASDLTTAPSSFALHDAHTIIWEGAGWLTTGSSPASLDRFTLRAAPGSGGDWFPQ